MISPDEKNAVGVKDEKTHNLGFQGRGLREYDTLPYCQIYSPCFSVLCLPLSMEKYISLYHGFKLSHIIYFGRMIVSRSQLGDF